MKESKEKITKDLSCWILKTKKKNQRKEDNAHSSKVKKNIFCNNIYMY